MQSTSTQDAHIGATTALRRQFFAAIKKYSTRTLNRVQELVEADADGRCVVLPKPKYDDYDGLKVKYRVYKARNNEPVENCFVLRPDKDPAAVAALNAYAKSTENKQLAQDILNWMRAEAEAAKEGSK